MSPFFQRLPATLAAAFLAAFAFMPAMQASASPGSDSTWLKLAVPSERLSSPIFALTVNPADPQNVLIGTPGGSIFRSTDGGGSWKQVRKDSAHPVLTLAFDPYQPGLVLAGSRAAGALRSTDAGQTWQQQSGLGTASPRAFGFTRTSIAAGTDKGVFLSRGTDSWISTGLAQVSVNSVAVAALNDPARLLAGGDRDELGVALPLYQSIDGGNTWTAASGQARGSSIVAALAAGAVQKDVRPLLMGTNSGLYLSADNGASWAGPLSGNGTLPASDFNQLAFVKDRYDRFYVASDGGGSDQGGLWSTTDAGGHFSSLQVPLPEVTALAVSNEDQPTLYVATFRPSDHSVFLWSYHDTGAVPKAPQSGAPAPVAAPAPARATRSAAAGESWMLDFLAGPEAPYLAIGLAAGIVLLLTLVAYVRRGRVRRS